MGKGGHPLPYSYLSALPPPPSATSPSPYSYPLPYPPYSSPPQLNPTPFPYSYIPPCPTPRPIYRPLQPLQLTPLRWRRNVASVRSFAMTCVGAQVRHGECLMLLPSVCWFKTFRWGNNPATAGERPPQSFLAFPPPPLRHSFPPTPYLHPVPPPYPHPLPQSPPTASTRASQLSTLLRPLRRHS